MKTFNQQLGVGLIEVLVAVLVLSVGILGLVSMQLTAKRTGNESVQRITAVYLAQGLAEKMRMNKGQLPAYVLDWPNETPAAAGTDCSAAACTAEQLAAYDLNQWITELQGAAELRTVAGSDISTGGLLDPSACVTNNAGMVTIAIAWKGFRAMSNPSSTSCGEDTGLYGTDNVHRQVMSFSTYMSIF
ncbi:MAG: type IV pilus modification protein PilV [Cellvibrionaceae bacterium]